MTYIDYFLQCLESGFSESESYNKTCVLIKRNKCLDDSETYQVKDIMDRIIRLKGVTK